MEACILKLKKEHQSILASLEKVSRIGVDSIRGRKQLIEIKRKLSQHIEVNIKYLHNSLDDENIFNKNRNSLQKELTLYRYEINNFIQNISKFSRPMFSKSIQGKNCRNDFEKLVLIFNYRLSQKEDLLEKNIMKSEIDKNKKASD